MAVGLANNWFTEISEKTGTALSYQIVEKLHTVVTPYQTIDIYETAQFGNLMVIDGCVMLTARDNFLYHEMMSHPGLFTHANPKNVVIIGGGDCGTLREVAKHTGVEHITQIEIDEQVTRLAEKYFPGLCSANQDPRVSLKFEDGIAWIKNTPAGSLDLIIVDSTDPIGPAEGLFTQAFYEDCYRALGKGGILVQQSESPLLHMALIKSMHQAMSAAGYNQVKTLPFPQPCYPSGWWSCTMAGKGVELDKPRLNDISNKSFETIYYNREIHEAALAQPEYMKNQL